MRWDRTFSGKICTTPGIKMGDVYHEAGGPQYALTAESLGEIFRNYSGRWRSRQQGLLTAERLKSR